MPALSRNLQSTVFFLYRTHPKSGEIDGPCGTGVIVGLPNGAIDPARFVAVRHAYAVTCHHNLAVGASIIRINTSDGKSRDIEFEPHEWQFIRGADDLCAVDITDRQAATDDIMCIPRNLCAVRDFIKLNDVGVGEDGFMLGLFEPVVSQRRNIIAGRFGNVALLAQDDHPIEQGHGRLRPSHIFDMHSRPGFSGSPVFIYRTPSTDLRDIHMQRLKLMFGAPETLSEPDWAKNMQDAQNTFLMLLGIHSAQYNDIVEAKKVATASNRVRGNIPLEIPGSMTVVVPAWEALRLIEENSTFIAQRQAREVEDAKRMDRRPIPERAPTKRGAPDAETAAAKPEENPAHREDFNRLVSAASKSKPKGGRT